MSEATTPANILVVDDTIENLRLLSNMLGAHGYDVRPVTSGAEALRAARSDPPDLVLLDITMPEMDGYEVCAAFKSTSGLATIPVVFLTALGDTADKVKAFKAGGADYITKPFQIEEVVARVDVHLALRRAQDELRQSYERLRELERLRDDLVHMIVHDMRSPLTAMMGNLEFLKMDAAAGLSTQSAADLDAVIHASALLAQMTNDLLDVSRLEEGKLPLDTQVHDLAKIAGAVRTTVSGWDRTRVIDLDAVSPTEVVCDGSMIYRTLENLVGNAVKHTPPTGRIRISVTPAARCIHVAVHDEGAGVPLEARERIFQKFGALETRKDRTYHSSGLGLAFCKLAIEAHHGAIGVHDGASGGSVFWFELPV